MNELHIIGKGAAKTVYASDANPDVAFVVANQGREPLLSAEIARLIHLQGVVPSDQQNHLALAHTIVEKKDNPPSLQGRLVVQFPKATCDLERAFERSAANWSVAQRVELCAQAALGVSALHKADVVHGDLKPENFLFYEGVNSSLKLSDFGLTQQLDARERKIYTSGNEAFKAPDASLSQQAEVFSLGLICIRILEESILRSSKTSTLIAPETSLLSRLQKKPNRGVAQFLISDKTINKFSSNHPFACILRAIRFVLSFIHKETVSDSDYKKESRLHEYIDALNSELMKTNPELKTEIDEITTLLKQMTLFDPNQRMNTQAAMQAWTQMAQKLSMLDSLEHIEAEFEDCLSSVDSSEDLLRISDEEEFQDCIEDESLTNARPIDAYGRLFDVAFIRALETTR